MNAVARVETELDSRQLLATLNEIERAFGRKSAERNAPRPLDLDIIDYNEAIEGGPPTLPHPRLHERAFVLIPLRDVAPGWTHPISKRRVDRMIEFLPADARELTRLE